jgi:DNA-binding ferritin-like protein
MRKKDITKMLNEWKGVMRENFYDITSPEESIVAAINTIAPEYSVEIGPENLSFQDDAKSDCNICQHSLSDLFVDMLWLRDQSHVFHWQTYSHAQHQALGDYYEKYIDLVDDLAEMIMGALQERPSVEGQCIELVDYSEKALADYLVDAREVFDNTAKEVIPETYSEIHNKIEEVVELIDKLSYLVTLK